VQELPHDVFALFVLAFVFGIKHGLDPDHLAAIDGLSRFNASSKTWLAKWAGVFFSMGHGLVVTLVIGIVTLMPVRITFPVWLDGLGAFISILTLLLLGVLNLYATFNSKKEIVRPVGLKDWMYFQSGHPVIVLGIGALFALSFDTMSQAVFFSLAASHVSIHLFAFTFGIVFTCGMIVSDGINGMLTARFIKQSGERALIASKVMSFAIGSMSLLIAFIGIARLAMPIVSEKIEFFGIWSGMIVLLWVTAGFVVSIYISQSTAMKKWNS
jgi:high-affinity nickel-transport protein